MSKKTAIVGGGITGLALAWLLKGSNREISVLEGSDAFGGLLRSQPIAGYPIEHFYHHFFLHDEELKWLATDLGLEQALHYFKGSMGIYRNQSLHSFSSSGDLLKLPFLNLVDKFRLGLASLYLSRKKQWQPYEQTRALSWIKRTMGQRAHDNVWSPLFNIKFGSFAEDIPLSWLIGRLSQRTRSRNTSGEKLGYIELSFENLIRHLCERLKAHNVRLLTNQNLTDLSPKANQLAVNVNGLNELYDEVILTLPTTAAAKLLRRDFAIESEKLEAIQYYGAVCVILELDQPLSSYYWINVCDPGFPFGGVIEHTNLVPKSWYNHKSIVYLSRYFESNHELVKMPDHEIKDLFISSLTKMFPHLQYNRILSTQVHRTLKAANVCTLGFSKLVPSCHTSHPGLWIANMTHVYPDERSTNNAIRVACEMAKLLGAEVNVPLGANLAGQLMTV